MQYRSELERLMTLTAEDIDAACRGERLGVLITNCFDEHLELAELADEAAAKSDADAHSYYSQEAAAWRATAQLLRRLAADPSAPRASGAA